MIFSALVEWSVVLGYGVKGVRECQPVGRVGGKGKGRGGDKNAGK